jgi:hypothetical protein
LLLGHTSDLGGVGSGSGEGEVVSSELSVELEESLDNELFDLASLFERVARGESESSEGSSGSATGGLDVFAGGVNLSGGDLGAVHIGRVNGIGLVATVAAFNNGVHDILEHSPGFFISSDESTGLDHGMSGVIDTGLDAVTEVDSESGLHALVFVIKAGIVSEALSEKRRVVGDIGE